jgi:hypothetical protein
LFLYDLPLASASGLQVKRRFGFSQIVGKKSIILIALAKAIKELVWLKLSLFFISTNQPLAEASGNLYR